MKTKKVTRHFCDHCGKGSFQRPARSLVIALRGVTLICGNALDLLPVRCNAVISDPPFGARTHAGHDAIEGDGRDNSKRAGLGYSHWTQLNAMTRIVEDYSEPGSSVLDFCMGGGTTGIACIRTGRKFIGIEKDPAHFKTAVERIKRELESPQFDFPTPPQIKPETMPLLWSENQLTQGNDGHELGLFE